MLAPRTTARSPICLLIAAASSPVEVRRDGAWHGMLLTSALVASLDPLLADFAPTRMDGAG
jgi:hypothetical protein